MCCNERREVVVTMNNVEETGEIDCVVVLTDVIKAGEKSVLN